MTFVFRRSSLWAQVVVVLLASVCFLMSAVSTDAAEAKELPASLTLSYVLEWEEAVEDISSVTSTYGSDYKAYLAANGVSVTDEEAADEAKLLAAVQRMEHRSFWPTHASLHPNKRRVANWLWVHRRYRNQAKDMLEMTDAKKQKAAFDKLVKKIDSHSEFENTQLFLYFLDAGKGEKERFIELFNQHNDLGTVEVIRQAFTSGADETVCEAAQPYLERYVQELHDHLRFEEETVTKVWLQLTKEEYKKYRTYLSWTYSVLY
eukprot:Nitzschia sp. Nitz4//scaffold317_size20466//14802//15587//NITZ4_008666-RA/size20466-processed-gene-0.11-mRNA-1//1//CDS//3329547545//2685//frame0